jgi:DNA-binding PadR family transcriptional regulator
MTEPLSTLGYALLGLLAREPLSGYELAQRLRVPIGYFWHARHSQIYPELARLTARGLVSYRVVAQADRPAKKVYSLTPAGRAALAAWVVAPTPPSPTRDELVLKAYSLWLADPRAAAARFRERQRLHLERLARYEQIQAHLERERADELARPDSPAFATYATLRRGLGYEREAAAWCGWVAEQLERRAHAGDPEARDEGPHAPGG